MQEPRSEEHQTRKPTKVRFSGEVRRIRERSSSESSSGLEEVTSEDEEPVRNQWNSGNLGHVAESQPATSSSREPEPVLKTEPDSPVQNTRMEDSDDSDVSGIVTDEEDSNQRISDNQLNKQSQEQFIPRWESLKKNGVLDIKKNYIIQYRPKGQSDSDWKTSTVHSYAGKVTGKNNNRFNVTEVQSGETKDLKLNEFDLEKDTREAQTVFYMEDDITSIFAVNIPKTRHHEPGIQKAMQEEMSSWEKYSDNVTSLSNKYHLSVFAYYGCWTTPTFLIVSLEIDLVSCEILFLHLRYLSFQGTLQFVVVVCLHERQSGLIHTVNMICQNLINGALVHCCNHLHVIKSWY